MSRFTNSLHGYVAAVHGTYFARSVTVKIPEEQELDTAAVVHPARQVVRRDGSGGTSTLLTRRCRLTELESIRHDAVIRIDELDWDIDEVLHSDRPGVELLLVRRLKREQSRPNYRG